MNDSFADWAVVSAMLLSTAALAQVMPDFVTSNAAKAGFEKYTVLDGKRAFAYSADGGFGYSFSQPDEVQARRVALAACEDKRPRGKAFCQIVSTDGVTLKSADFASGIKREYADQLSIEHQFYRLIGEGDHAGAQSLIERVYRENLSSINPLDVLSVVERLPLDKAMGLLDPWVKASPNSWHAYAVRATFQLHRAWKERGNLPARRTSPERLDRMMQYLVSAKADAEKALSIMERCMKCHLILINATMLDGQRIDAARRFDIARKLFPANAEPYLAFLNTLQPEWGGSDKAMDGLVAEGHVALVPRAAASVAAQREFLRGFWAVSERDQTAAYSKALAFSDHHAAAVRLAEIRRSNGQYQAMLELTARNLRASPWDRYSLELKAIAQEKLGDNKGYVETIDKLLALNRRERTFE